MFENNSFWSSNEQRLKWVRSVLVLAMLLGIILSYRLWTFTHEFPLAPLLEFVPALNYPWDYVYLFVVIASLVLLLLRYAWWSLGIFVILSLYWLATDQMRWQPWFYQYLIMMILLAVAIKGDEEKRRGVLNSLRLVLISIYFFSGFLKLNPVFFKYGILSFTASIYLMMPDVVKPYYSLLSYPLPFLEMFAGVGLLFNITRKWAMAAAISMHLFIIIFIGLMQGWNFVVWPWNVAMICLVMVLFAKTSLQPQQLIVNRRFPAHIIVVVLFLVMPFTNLLGFWDDFPSWSLYTFTTKNMIIRVEPEELEQLPYNTSMMTMDKFDGTYIDVEHWSYSELSVPVYPEVRIFRKVAEDFCPYDFIDTSQIWIGPVHAEKEFGRPYTCRELVQ